jgi:hypothetical protein
MTVALVTSACHGAIVGRVLALFAREGQPAQPKGFTFDHPVGLQEQRAAAGNGLTTLGDSRMRDRKI